MKERKFDLEESRRYWRLAPSGAGKHDTQVLAGAQSPDLVTEWRRGFSKRFANYIEEDFFLESMAREFSGKRLLSIGSGLGFHEIFYANRGARVTCCDIVESNLKTVARVSQILGAEIETFVLRPDASLGGPYDILFIYGSLMTMPASEQQSLLEACAAALTPEGRIILMLYTWEFARATCGWSDPDEFDPQVFARASDESVGEEHCPWSDWHDDEKLLSVAPPGYVISRRQLWQQGWFVWYELSRSSIAIEPVSFFSVPDLPHSGARNLRLDEFAPGAASLTNVGSELRIRTEVTAASYAAISPVFTSVGSNSIIVDAEVFGGALSVGVLDDQEGVFLASHIVRMRGHATHVFSMPDTSKPIRIIISNFQDPPAASDFSIHGITLVRHSRASVDFAGALDERPLSSPT